MAHLLDSHLAVITGAGSGIGRAIALGYAREGARIVAVDTNLAAAAETARSISAAGGEATAKELDVTNRDRCNAVANDIASSIGKASILVNNAGITRRNPFTSSSDIAGKDWDDILGVNLDGVFNVTHAFVDQLRTTKGRIINIASVQAFVHVRTPSSAAYTVSKHGVLGLTRALAMELGKEGIRVNAIGPGLIETPLNEKARANYPDIVKTFIDHTPLGRAGKAEDIAGPAIFLASDLSSYVNGACLMVDGGYRAI